MEEIPEIISPHSDNSSELLLTPKYEKSMYIKELNIFKRKKSIDISFTENEKLTPWDYYHNQTNQTNLNNLKIIIPKINYNDYCSPIKENKTSNKF